MSQKEFTTWILTIAIMMVIVGLISTAILTNTFGILLLGAMICAAAVGFYIILTFVHMFSKWIVEKKFKENVDQ